MAAGSSETISVQCNCGKRLKAPSSAVGRKAKCPACGNVMRIEAPPPIEAESDEIGLAEEPNFDELAARESAAARIAAENDTAARCPNCKQPLDPSAALCINCGYDIRKGRVLGTATNVVHANRSGGFIGLGRKSTEREVDRPEGKFIFGLLLSIGFALFACLPWFAVALITDKDFYLLQVLVGLGAGLGMQIGQRGCNNRGGLAAAAVTFVMLVGARVLIVTIVLVPSLVKGIETAAKQKAADATAAAKEAQEEEIASRDPRVADIFAEAELKKQKIDPEANQLDEATLTKIDDAYSRARKRLRAMTREEYQAMLPQLEVREIRDRLISRQMDPELRSMGLNPDFQRIEEHNYKQARDNIIKRVDAMTLAQRKAELKKLDDRVLAEMQALQARSRDFPLPSELEDSQAAAAAAANASIAEKKGFSFGALLVFAILPMMFTLLAMATAYRTAVVSVFG